MTEPKNKNTETQLQVPVEHHPYHHPSYEHMVVEAIQAVHKGRKGASQVAIAKYLRDTYDLPEEFPKILKHKLTTMQNDDEIKKEKASFKLTPKGHKVLGDTHPTKRRRSTEGKHDEAAEKPPPKKRTKKEVAAAKPKKQKSAAKSRTAPAAKVSERDARAARRTATRGT